ncbi:MAG: hypothetical protein JNJ96_11490 [Anaerolineales bacterium]|nr:hypothetical protein [Anaerolineales bacterium]
MGEDRKEGKLNLMKKTSGFPERPITIGKKGKSQLPNGNIEKFTIVDEICIPQSGLPSKLIYLQKIRFDDGKKELRLCYYIIGKLPKLRGKWVFGQYATFLPSRDFRTITNKAKKKGWI